MDKIDKLIEEGLGNWVKNNKLTTGLGAGALGAGAYGLSEYLNAGDQYTDSTLDNAQIDTKADSELLDNEKEARPRLMKLSEKMTQSGEDEVLALTDKFDKDLNEVRKQRNDIKFARDNATSANSSKALTGDYAKTRHLWNAGMAGTGALGLGAAALANKKGRLYG